jgi:ABC-2 type transport system permease protein
MTLHPELIWAIIRLRLRRVAADRANLIWLVVMPLVFSFIMGELMGNWSQGASPRATFVVYGAANGGEQLEELLAPLRDHEDFELSVRDTTASRVRIRSLLEDRRVSGALLIGEGFADSLAAGLRPVIDFYHDSERSSSQGIRRAFEPVFAAQAVRLTARGLVDPAAAPEDPGKAAAFDTRRFDQLIAEPRVRLETEVLGRPRGADLTLTDSRQHSGPAYTLMFILMFLLMSAKDLVEERRHRTLDRLRLAWPSSADLVLGYFLAGMAVGGFQAALLLGANAAVFGIDYGPHPACLVLVMLLFVAVSSAAGLLLGTLSRSGGQADGLGMVFGLGLPALGGLWWPLEVVPPFMQSLGKALPTGQAITVFHDMIGRGWGIAETAPLLLGLAGWAVVLLVLATVFFRREVTA